MNTPSVDSNSNAEFIEDWFLKEQKKGLVSIHLSLVDPQAPMNALSLRSELVSLFKAPILQDPEHF